MTLLFLLCVCFVVVIGGGYYAYKNMGSTLTIAEDGAPSYKMRTIHAGAR